MTANSWVTTMLIFDHCHWKPNGKLLVDIQLLVASWKDKTFDVQTIPQRAHGQPKQHMLIPHSWRGSDALILGSNQCCVTWGEPEVNYPKRGGGALDICWFWIGWLPSFFSICLSSSVVHVTNKRRPFVFLHKENPETLYFCHCSRHTYGQSWDDSVACNDVDKCEYHWLICCWSQNVFHGIFARSWANDPVAMFLVVQGRMLCCMGMVQHYSSLDSLCHDTVGSVCQPPFYLDELLSIWAILYHQHV